MVKLHLQLPFDILLGIDFLYTLAAVMGKGLKHFVILRLLTLDPDEDSFNPGLTADDLSTTVGTIHASIGNPTRQRSCYLVVASLMGHLVL